MKILIAGASGLIGSALASTLRGGGHAVFPLVRPPRIASPGQVSWNPEWGEMDAAAAAGADAVVNLAGANVGERRWSESRKRELRSSRVDTTRALVETLARLDSLPRSFVSASAVGYYGSRGDDPLDETSPAGTGFLARLCADWEAEALGAERRGMRTVVLRFGVILSRRGGALAQMLGPFRLGLGGRLGDGRQWMPWIGLDDAVGMLREAVEGDRWRGAYNAVAPEPVTNLEFTKALGRTLRRPTFFPVPRAALRTLFGEMADEMLLASQRVRSLRLPETGYSYSYPELEPALRRAITRG